MKNLIPFIAGCALGMATLTSAATAENTPIHHVLDITFSADAATLKLTHATGSYTLLANVENKHNCAGPVASISALQKRVQFNARMSVNPNTKAINTYWHWCDGNKYKVAKELNMQASGAAYVCFRPLNVPEGIASKPPKLARCGVFTANWSGPTKWTRKAEIDLAWQDFGKQKLIDPDRNNQDTVQLKNKINNTTYTMAIAGGKIEHCRPYKNYASGARLLSLAQEEYRLRRHEVNVAWCDENIEATSRGSARLALVCLKPLYQRNFCSTMQLTWLTSPQSELAQHETD